MNLEPSGNAHSWVSRFRQRFRQKRTQEHELRVTIEKIVDLVDPDIRQVRRYQQVLRQPVIAAMEHCGTMVEQIPGPVRLDRGRYYADPLVRTVFVSAEQMKEIVNGAVENGSGQEWQGEKEAVALLTMTRTERTIFTHEQQKNMVVGDVAKRTINFVDHRIVEPTPSLTRTKIRLQHRGIEVMATLALEKIDTLRAGIAELRERKIHLQSMRRILGGRNHALNLFSRPSVENSNKIQRINGQLAELDAELEVVQDRLATPADSLLLLRQHIESIADSITVRQKQLRVDWMNVLQDEQIGDEGQDIALAELSFGEDMQRWAVMVKFPLDEKRDG